jgi:hypothetical protein
MEAVAEKFPEEFKRDVVRVARRGDLTIAEVAADIDDGVKDGMTTAEQAEIVAAPPGQAAPRRGFCGLPQRPLRLGLPPADPHVLGLHDALVEELTNPALVPIGPHSSGPDARPDKAQVWHTYLLPPFYVALGDLVWWGSRT